MGNNRSVESQTRNQQIEVTTNEKSIGIRSSKTKKRTAAKKSSINYAQRQIVRGCVDKAKDDIADRIYRRIYDKRDDFRIFVCSLPSDMMIELSTYLKEFLFHAAEDLMDCEKIRRSSEELGAKHVKFRVYGFRPDFFAAIADAVTVECVLLDGAVRQASETLSAWSAFTTMVFSSVRDGFYNEQRRMRRIGSTGSTPNPSKDSLNSSFESSNEDLGRKHSGVISNAFEQHIESRSSLPNFPVHTGINTSLSNDILHYKMTQGENSGDDISRSSQTRSDLTLDELSDSIVEVKHRCSSDDILICIEDVTDDEC